MEDKQLKEFSRTALFLVTGLCFFLFNWIMKLLEGNHLPFFNWIGGASLLFGLFNGIGTLLARVEHKKKNPSHQ